MSQSVQDLFREHTHVDGDYFLMEILKVLGVVEDEDLSIPHHNTRTLFLDKMGRAIGSCNITEDCLEIKRIKQAEQIEEIRVYLSGGADHICAVVQCETDCDEELVNVALEKESGTLFIFSAFFCTRHKVAFARYPQALAMYVRDNKIRGVDPKCIKIDLLLPNSTIQIRKAILYPELASKSIWRKLREKVNSIRANWNFAKWPNKNLASKKYSI